MKKITFFFFLLAASFGYSQTVLENFEGTAPTLGFSNGDGTATIVTDPETGGTRGNVLEIITAAAQAPWQQGELTLQGDIMDLTTNKVVTVDVYSTTAFDMLARVEPGVGSGAIGATDASHGGTGWETLSFDFNSNKDNQAVANGQYEKIFFFNLWDSSGNGGAGAWAYGNGESAVFTSYVDNITATAIERPVDLTLPSSPSPTPPSITTHLALLDNVTDTGTFSNFWNATYNFGAGPEFPDLDDTEATNVAAKINLSVGWGGGISVNSADVKTDLSDYDMVHIDYYIPNIDAGVNGHQFYLDLISQTDGANSEAFYGFGTTVAATNDSGTVDEVIVFDAWQSIDIPLSAFANKGFSATEFLQFKIAAQSDIRTQLGYFDNIYFYKDGTASTKNNELLGFSMFPNPAENVLQISAKESISNVEMFNVLGKRVKSFTMNSTNKSLDISDLSSGIYLVKFVSAGKTGTAKFIKK